MGLFDGIIGAETPVSNMDESMTPPVSGGSGTSGGSTGDDGTAPVVMDQTNPPLITASNIGEDDTLIIHSESEIGNTVATKDIMDFDIGMPDIIAKNPQTIDTKPEISLIDATSEVQPVSNEISTESIIEMSPISLSNNNNNNPDTLEDRIAGFVADLERLKADDEMILHEKESAIEKLETEMKELSKEIKKIQADEKRIDATIASINTPTTKTK